MTPHPTNTRRKLRRRSPRSTPTRSRWFGIEQEYTFFKDGRPLGFPFGGFPAPQGGYYCGVGADEVYGRDVVEAHMRRLPRGRPRSSPASTPRSCPASGSSRSARSAPLEVADQLWIARWLLYRIAEDFGIAATLDPKPVKGDWNGAGAHTNFSTKAMREGYDADHHGVRGARREADEHVDRLRRRHRGPPHRPARDRPVDRVQLRRVRPRRVGAHPVAGRGRQEGLHRGPPAQRQLRPVHRHPRHHRDDLRRPGVAAPTRRATAIEGALRGRPRRVRRVGAVRFRAMEERTPHEVLELVEAEGVEFVDLRFCDLPGVMQHVSIPANVLDEGQFEDGHAFDGSSVRGFQEIQESDMVLVADPNTAYLDPFRTRKTLVLHCYVADPVTGERYSRDPRYVAQKAQEHLFSTGVADTAYFGPEPEFFIFDDVRFETTPQRQLLPGRLGRGAVEHRHRRGPEPRVQAADQGGLLPRPADGPLPGPALGDGGDAARRSASQTELHHHEVASGGQGEIGIRFDTLLAMADKLMTFKYVLKNVAWAAGKSAHVHAEADLRGQRLGHAHPPVAVEGRRAALLRRGRLRRACPTWPAGTSAACCTTPTR